MKRAVITTTVCLYGLFSFTASAKSLYCPQGQAYIQVGMTEPQVITACGKPTVKSKPTGNPTHKMTVTQLIYSSLSSNNPYPGIQAADFTQWSLPSGPTASVGLQVDIIANKVSSIQLNGAQTNAMSLCHGGSIKIGDNLSQVYALCGQPSATNNSYVDQPYPGHSQQEIWTYQLDQYQPPINLTFINGSLESID